MWHSDLYLRLDKAGSGKIEVISSDTTNFKTFPLTCGTDKIAQKSLLAANTLNTLVKTQSQKSFNERHERLKKIGRELFNLIFVNCEFGGVSYLSDILDEALKVHQNTVPFTITIDGAALWIPWELVLVPSRVLKGDTDKFLGEIAIISTIPANIPQSLGLKKYTYDSNKYQFPLSNIASFPGGNLNYVKNETEFLAEKASSINVSMRKHSPTNSKRGRKSNRTNYNGFVKHLDFPAPADIIHGAFHHKAIQNKKTENQGFSIELLNKVRLNNTGFDHCQRESKHKNFAFYNACNSMSKSKSLSGGVGSYSFGKWFSHSVVASLIAVNDKLASNFANEFFDEILPLNSFVGETVGFSLYKIRNNWKSDGEFGERFFGFGYRLIGNPEYRFSV